jgi:hypothetical protein
MAFFQQTNDDDGFLVVGSKKRVMKTCEHCGKQSNFILTCKCEQIIDQFGALSCSTCKITYGVCMSIETYIIKSAGNEAYALMTYWGYFTSEMPVPCSVCSYHYRLEYNKRNEAFTKWSDAYIEKYGYPERDYEYDYDDYDYNDYYDEPCRSGRGGICPCCGD